MPILLQVLSAKVTISYNPQEVCMLYWNFEFTFLPTLFCLEENLVLFG
jgi:hypothetical protein